MSSFIEHLKHLKALCEEHDIRPVVVPDIFDSKARKYQYEGEEEVYREVNISKCDTVVGYTVALHEIGHMVAENGMNKDDVWGSELAASRWAIANAEHPIDMDAILFGLQTYDHTKTREQLLSELGV